MSRIRSIKPKFFKHEELFDAEKATGLPLRLAYAGLWTVADREGRFRWKPRTIKTDVLPYDDVDMNAVMDALAKYGFVVKYRVKGEDYGYIPTFSEHQHVNPREAPSTLPSPDEADKVSDAKPTRLARVKHATETRTESNVQVALTSCSLDYGDREGKGRDISLAPLAEREGFPAFYDAFPKKVGRRAAEKAYKSALSRASPETILAGVRRYATEREGEDAQYTAHPASWLNQDRWADEPRPKKKTRDEEYLDVYNDAVANLGSPARPNGSGQSRSGIDGAGALLPAPTGRSEVSNC